MGRAQASMELISNQKARKITFEKRKKGLEKKAHELSTLCGVKVGFIILAPKEELKNKPILESPSIWPENPREIHSLISSLEKENFEDRKRRSTDLSMFYKDRTKKAEEELSKLQKKNIEARLPTWDERYESLSSDDLKIFHGILESKLLALRARIDFMKGTQTYFADHHESSGSGHMMMMMMMNSNCQEHDQENPYMIQTMFRKRSMQLEFLQPQPLSAFNPQFSLHDLPNFHNNSNIMINPYNINDGASSSNSMIKIENSPEARCNNSMMPGSAAVVAEHGGGSNINEAAFRYNYNFPAAAMQPTPLYLQYSLNSRASPQMHSSQTEAYYDIGDFQFVHQK